MKSTARALLHLQTWPDGMGLEDIQRNQKPIPGFQLHQIIDNPLVFRLPRVSSEAKAGTNSDDLSLYFGSRFLVLEYLFIHGLSLPNLQNSVKCFRKL